MKLNAVILAFFLPACATTGTGPGATFDNCSSAAGQSAASGLLGQVTTALATGDYEAELAKLVATYGAAEVVCAVQLAVAELQKKAASEDKLVGVELTNGNAYLAAHPAK